jgi:hypothetical protein
MGVQDVDGGVSEEGAHPVHITQPGRRMETGIKLETFK